MALTERQSRAARLLVANPSWSQARCLREAGYSKATTRDPGTVFKQPHVIEEIERLRAEQQERHRQQVTNRGQAVSPGGSINRAALQAIADNPDARHSDRIRAVELIARMDGEFHESKTAQRGEQADLVRRLQKGRLQLGPTGGELRKEMMLAEQHIEELESLIAEMGQPYQPWSEIRRKFREDWERRVLNEDTDN